MHMVGLKVVFVVWVLLDIIDVVLEVLEEPVQVLAPLAARYIRDSKKNVLIIANMAAEYITVFNVSVLLTQKVCWVQMLFWLL